MTSTSRLLNVLHTISDLGVTVLNDILEVNDLGVTILNDSLEINDLGVTVLNDITIANFPASQTVDGILGVTGTFFQTIQGITNSSNTQLHIEGSKNYIFRETFTAVPVADSDWDDVSGASGYGAEAGLNNIGNIQTNYKTLDFTSEILTMDCFWRPNVDGNMLMELDTGSTSYAMGWSAEQIVPSNYVMSIFAGGLGNIDFSVIQSNWNLDPADGTGNLPLIIDWQNYFGFKVSLHHRGILEWFVQNPLSFVFEPVHRVSLVNFTEKSPWFGDTIRFRSTSINIAIRWFSMYTHNVRPENLNTINGNPIAVNSGLADHGTQRVILASDEILNIPDIGVTVLNNLGVTVLNDSTVSNTLGITNDYATQLHIEGNKNYIFREFFNDIPTGSDWTTVTDMVFDTIVGLIGIIPSSQITSQYKSAEYSSEILTLESYTSLDTTDSNSHTIIEILTGVFIGWDYDQPLGSYRIRFNDGIFDLTTQQSSWNIDNADGTGALPVIDFTQFNSFRVSLHLAGYIYWSILDQITNIWQPVHQASLVNNNVVGKWWSQSLRFEMLGRMSIQWFAIYTHDKLTNNLTTIHGLPIDLGSGVVDIGTQRMVLASDEVLNVPDIGVTISSAQTTSLLQTNLGIFTTDSGVNRFFLQGFHESINISQHGLCNGMLGGETFFLPTTNFQTFSIVSSSALDIGVTGTGARTILVNYEDEDGNSATTFVTMNGTTPVLTDVGSAIILNLNTVSVVTSGSLNTNAGIIKCTHESTTTDILITVGAGDSRTISAKEYIPRERAWYLKDINAYISSLSTNDILSVFLKAKVSDNNTIFTIG